MEENVVIDVRDLTVRFNRSANQPDNLKECVIRLLRREKLFQEFLALQDVRLRVRAGESWGLVGTNGSGKSTLLKTVSGILRPHRGSVTVRGTVAPLIELGAGFDPELTGRENILLSGCILGHSERFMRSHFEEIADFSELGDFLEEPLKNYSSGMRARMGFSVATVVKPDILIVDEILSVGDVAFRRKCEARMQQLLSGGTTLLYVSHSADEVMRMCRHALWLDRGRVRMQGSATEVCTAYLDAQKK